MSIKSFVVVYAFGCCLLYGQNPAFVYPPGTRHEYFHQKENHVPFLPRVDSIISQDNRGANSYLRQQVLSIHPLHRTTGYTNQLYLPDTVMVYSTVDTSQYVISYNPKGLFTRGINKKLTNGNWVNAEQQNLTYDVYGKRISELDERWSGGQWMATERYRYVYDAGGRNISLLNEQWSNGQLWQYRYTYTYDVNGKRESELEEQWLNGQVWTNNRKYTYTYNAGGSIISELTEQWLHGYWTNDEQDFYTYDSCGNNISLLVQSWSDGQWNNYIKYFYVYNSQMKKVSELWQYWLYNQWINAVQYLYTYDINGLITAELVKYYQYSQWINNLQYLYTYDAVENRLSELIEYWSAGQWNNYLLTSCRYDSFHHLLSESFSVWSGFSWQPNDASATIEAGDYQYSVQCCQLNLSYAFLDTTLKSTSVSLCLMSQNFPNPFNSSTTIVFNLPFKGFVSLKVYDMLGRGIASLVHEALDAGLHAQQWNAGHAASGVYFYRLQVSQSMVGLAEPYTETKKIILLR